MRLSHIEHRIDQQLTLSQLIDKAVDNLIKVGYSNLTPQRVYIRMTALKESWEKFLLVHEALQLAITKLNLEEKYLIQRHSYFSENIFEKTHESYLEAIEKMNSLLEPENEIIQRPPSTSSDLQNSHQNVSFSSVLLATALITVSTHTGESIKARALIDQGSEISLISERLVQILRLPKKHSVISLVGIGAQSHSTKGIVSFKIRPHFETGFECIVSAHVLPKLTGSIPSIKIKERNWPHLQELQLADKDFTTPGVIDVVLGADVYAQIIENGFVKGETDCPIAQ